MYIQQDFIIHLVSILEIWFATYVLLSHIWNLCFDLIQSMLVRANALQLNYYLIKYKLYESIKSVFINTQCVIIIKHGREFLNIH